jgi:hypothetical protein
MLTALHLSFRLAIRDRQAFCARMTLRTECWYSFCARCRLYAHWIASAALCCLH